jgi:hypothetical protein
MTIERPTPHLVEKSCLEFDAQDAGYDAAVQLVFKQWPLSTVRAEILVKVVVLNRLYSTNIYNVSTAVDRILELDFDRRSKEGDLSLVNELAQMKFSDRTRNCLSFASKYCAWHNQDVFPIFDTFIENQLYAQQAREPFCDFSMKLIRDYAKFCEALERFRAKYGLTAFSLRQLDKYLWMEGSKASKAEEAR